MEIWKPIKEFENYAISNHGRVKLIKKTKTNYRIGMIYKTWERNIYNKKTGKRKENVYQRIGLSKNNKNYHFTIHELVLSAFNIPRPKNKFVNHNDCDKKNNHISNLEWTTYHENINHAIKNDCFLKGEEISISILTNSQVLKINKMLKKGKTYKEIKLKFPNVKRSNLSSIKNGHSWAWLTGNEKIKTIPKNVLKENTVKGIYKCILLGKNIEEIKKTFPEASIRQILYIKNKKTWTFITNEMDRKIPRRKLRKGTEKDKNKRHSSDCRF